MFANLKACTLLKLSSPTQLNYIWTSHNGIPDGDKIHGVSNQKFERNGVITILPKNRKEF
jgi:hypothetical protein